MTYELAKELKDAGFPPHPLCNECMTTGDIGVDMCVPTLSELIEACKSELVLSCTKDNFLAFHYVDGKERRGVGPTAEDAVANLWLALNRKEK